MQERIGKLRNQVKHGVKICIVIFLKMCKWLRYNNNNNNITIMATVKEIQMKEKLSYDLISLSNVKTNKNAKDKQGSKLFLFFLMLNR